MPMRPDDIKRVLSRYHDQLIEHREALNGLNVYPVPDGDTGTNMTLTMGSVVEALAGAESMAEVAEAMARASLLGARGNSGIILSQILRGMSEVIGVTERVGVAELAGALDRASSAAYEAVQRPVEGTMLTVLRESSEEAARSGAAGEDLPALLTAVFERAESALSRTPDMLPVLKEAGVVDAGGAGILLLFGALLEVAAGADVQLPEQLLRVRADLASLQASGLDAGTAGLRYEVMFMLDAPDDRIAAFREHWATLGDSIVVVGGDGTWNCHIHTDIIGPAIEAGIAVGGPRGIAVTDLREQAGDHAAHPARFAPRPEALEATIGVVTVVAGPGLTEVFRQLGAQAVVAGGQSMNPSTEDLLAAVEAVPADRVVVLPNNKNIVPVAEQLDLLTTKDVAVVPTRSVPQGIAAMVGYNPAGTDVFEATEDMAAAASAVVTGEITRAVRDANVAFGSISKGDWIGIADGTIVIADRDQETVLRGLVAAILPLGSELLTLYVGEGAHGPATKALEAWLGELHPTLRMETVDGGQPLYPYLVSIE
jgi:uncharacterized protein